MSLGSGEWVTPAIQLVRQVDAGAMGSVWVADHTALATEVAVKFVAERFVDNPAALRRLEAEARSAAQIKSPHVVKIFDYGIFEGKHPYFVMEYLEGEALRDRLDREGTLPPRDVAQLVTHVARGLLSAHRVGVVHRDIKPQNLFLLEEDDAFFVKIVDFGVAKGLTKGLTEPGVLVGTPIYMSREAVIEQVVDHRADLWALAVVAYEALTGELPFDGETLDEVCTAIWRGTFLPPSRFTPELTPAVDEWFSSALHRDPTERPASAKELATSFVQALATVPGMGGAEVFAGDSWRISHHDLAGELMMVGARASGPTSVGALTLSQSDAPRDSVPISTPPLPNVNTTGTTERRISLAAESTSGVSVPPAPSRRRYALFGLAALCAAALAVAFMSSTPEPASMRAAPASLREPSVVDSRVARIEEPRTPASATAEPSASTPRHAPPAGKVGTFPPIQPATTPARPQKDLGF